MAEKDAPKGIVGPSDSTKYVVGPMDFPKGITQEELAELIGPNSIIRSTDIKNIVGPMDDPSGIKLAVGSLNRVNVALLINNTIVLLRCKTCGTLWAPILQKGKHLALNWWSCPKNKAHSKNSQE